MLDSRTPYASGVVWNSLYMILVYWYSFVLKLLPSHIGAALPACPSLLTVFLYQHGQGKYPEGKVSHSSERCRNENLCIVSQRKTGECFGLNGAIFLGSILLWDNCLAPGMRWMLGGLRSWAGPTGAEALIALLKATFVVWWLLPVYCISFALSCVW